MVRMTIRSGARVTRPTRVAVSTTRGGGEKGGGGGGSGWGIVSHDTQNFATNFQECKFQIICQRKVFVISGLSVFVT